MLYFWLVILSLALVYLFYTVGVIMDAVETIQEFKLEEYQEFSNHLDEQLERLEKINRLGDD